MQAWQPRLSRWLSGKRIHLPMQEPQETRVCSLGQEEPLEEGMAIHSLYALDSCLENPLDRGVWRATVHGVTKSWAQLSN